MPHLVAVIPLSNNVFVNEKMMDMINTLQKADIKLTTSVAPEGFSNLWLDLFAHIHIYNLITYTLLE